MCFKNKIKSNKSSDIDKMSQLRLRIELNRAADSGQIKRFEELFKRLKINRFNEKFVDEKINILLNNEVVMSNAKAHGITTEEELIRLCYYKRLKNKIRRRIRES